ncbi:hypothetical protein [Oceanobacter kriegii]|uniref:hypothetical protein n=1 Tax=Oceanobacter kriegii TaxID=64972 RepID=UPI0012EC1065|nr:hypothetical protein [Oceanobacter kriegii]
MAFIILFPVPAGAPARAATRNWQKEGGRTAIRTPLEHQMKTLSEIGKFPRTPKKFIRKISRRQQLISIFFEKNIDSSLHC